MRMHAVITPPPHALADLAAAVERAAKVAPGVPWLPPSAWQLRLAYFGSLGLAESVAVRETMSRVGSYCPPLSLRILGIEAVPDDDAADSLVVGLAGSVDELWSLARAIPSMVQQHGLFLDRRSFQPTITIAEGLRSSFNARRATASLATYQGVPWTAEEMRIVRWRPGTAGEPDGYEEIEHHTFTAPRPDDADERVPEHLPEHPARDESAAH